MIWIVVLLIVFVALWAIVCRWIAVPVANVVEKIIKPFREEK